jgi:hypothetical protein
LQAEVASLTAEKKQRPVNELESRRFSIAPLQFGQE